MNAVEASKVLNIDPPFTAFALRDCYLTQAKLHHPDKGGDADAFKAVKQAYDRLKPLVDANIPTILQWGQGLGPQKNGKPCHRCTGKGYTTRTYHKTVECPMCHGKGRKFCGMCFNTGFASTVEEEILYDKCYVCDGTGEIECFNPVIVKGRLKQR